MKKKMFQLLIGFVVLSNVAYAIELNPPINIPENQPKDVTTYANTRLRCDYYRFQPISESDTKEKQTHIKLIKKYCIGADAKLAKLKRKYSKSPDTLEYLSQFDAVIEVTPKE